MYSFGTETLNHIKQHQTIMAAQTTTFNIEDTYDISQYGFATDLSHVEFNDFVNVILTNLGLEIEAFRKIIHSTELPEDFTIEKYNFDQIKRIYSVMVMAMNKYVWGSGVKDSKTYYRIPAVIGKPAYLSSKYLGIKLSLTHAAVDLWNWKLKDNTKPFELDNIKVLNRMTQDQQEDWFYLVMIAIEGLFGSTLKDIPTMYEHSKMGNHKYVKGFLTNLKDDIEISKGYVKMMYEKLDPEFFFHNLRIFLSGSDKVDDGYCIQFDGKEHFIKNKGGSAAQSTIIKVLDVFLGVNHEGDIKDELDDTLNYMPKAHVDYVNYIKSLGDIHKYLNEENKIIFADCVYALNSFRQAHLGLVRHYVMKFINEGKKSDVHGDRGSQGTNPEVFCGGIIRDTYNHFETLKKSAFVTGMIDHDLDNGTEFMNVFFILMLIIFAIGIFSFIIFK